MHNDFTVTKRNGAFVNFDKIFIQRAIIKANSHFPDEKFTESQLDTLIEFIVNDLPIDETGNIMVRDIQDKVEEVLAAKGPIHTAKEFIIYRNAQDTRRRETADCENADVVMGILKKLGTNLGIDPSKIFTGGFTKSKLTYNEILTELILISKDYIKLSDDYDYLSGRLVTEQHRYLATNWFANRDIEHTTENAIKVLLEEGMYDPAVFNGNIKEIVATIDAIPMAELNFLSSSTLHSRYLVRSRDGVVIETPQMLFARMAWGMGMNSTIDKLQTYISLCTFEFFQSSPSMFNGGLVRPQMASCYLSYIPDDLIGIYDVLKENAQLSKYAGGLGLAGTSVRCAGSKILGTNGTSNGIIPFLKNIETMTVAVNQGGRFFAPMCGNTYQVFL